jgi:multiple sugar transport system ATP-binding protein
MNFIEASRLGETEAKTVGIRPEHITLSRENGDWKGKVIHVEHLGADTILYLETEVTGLLTVRLFGEHKYDVDDVVYATPDKASIHRFGADDRVLR